MTPVVEADFMLSALRPAKVADLKIDCLVLGGGLCGLATAIALKRAGHNVTVIERDPRTNQRGTGGGCRLPPNLTKILYRWGLGRKLFLYGTKMHILHLHSYETGEFLGYHSFPEQMLKEAGGDYAMIQYGDLWQILYESALESGAEVLSGLDVTDIDPNNSSVTVSNGDVLTADLIIGADGPRGRGRRILLDQDQTEERMPKSFMTYQATIPTERMTRYPELDELTKGQISRTIRLIFAEGKVLHFFPINHGSAYCIQYCPNDDSFEGHWGDKQITRLLDVAGICEPKILRIAEIADPAIAVRMPDNIKLEHWVHDSQQFIVVGEAAHPFPPASQQGIAMAFEDAAVLGKLFGHLSSKDQIGNFLYAFEDIRQTRCYSSFQDDVALYRFLAMPPGPNQRERDARLKESTREEGKEEGLDAVEDTSMARKQWEEVKKVYAYDCEDEADEWWIQWGVLRQRAAERNEFYDKSSFGSREA